MSNNDDKEKSMFLKYVITTYREQLKMAKDEIKPYKINIDYPMLNQYFIERTGKDFFQPSFPLFLKYAENRINKGRTDKNYISLSLVDVPPNALLHDLDATYNGQLISAKAMIKNITPIQVKPKVVASLYNNVNA